jgi:UDP-2-acetamido-3-amino-2,3-dideoxy-glucuronate N-acetyltransferase
MLNAKHETPNTKRKIMNYFAHETAIIDTGCEIAVGTKIWHFSHIMSSCIIGESCNIGQNVVISPHVQLGKNVKIQNNVSVYTGVICEDDVFLGPSMVFTNVINPRSHVNRKEEYAQTIVRRGASIGANATIVCGNEIGMFALIGAGAVVTKAVKAYALVIGNPARQTGWVSEYGHKLHFNEDGLAICPETKQEYKLEDTQVKRIS